MKKNNFIVSEKLQNDIVWLCVTDSEFLELTKGKLDTDWLPSAPAQDVVRICSEYFSQHGKAPNSLLLDELDDFLQDRPMDVENNYRDYLSEVFDKRKPLRSNVLGRIKNLIDVYSVQQVKKSPTFIDRDDRERLLSVNAGDIQSQEPEWFWYYRYPLGSVNIIAGEPGAGKSFWTLDTAARVSIGRPWPDVEGDNPKGSVLLISCEDTLEYTILPRLIASGADTSKIDVISTVKNAQGKRRLFNLQHDLELLENHMKADTRSIIFDPVSAFVGGAGFSMNTKVRSILDPLARFASRHNVTIFLVTHLNKNVRADATHRILGSVGQVAVARSITIIRKDTHNKDRRLLIPGKMNLRKEPPALAFWLRDGFIEYEPEPIDMDAMESWTQRRPTPRLDEAIEWLKDVLADGPVKSVEILEMAAEAGLAEDTLRRAKDELYVSVYKVGNNENACWYWAMPITGELSGNVEDAAEAEENHIFQITGETSDGNC
jgi:putative DNA primase/helicase